MGSNLLVFYIKIIIKNITFNSPLVGASQLVGNVGVSIILTVFDS